MIFTWDAEKNRQNVARHGIDFAVASRIFDGPTVEIEDDRFHYGELRIQAIGEVFGRLITVIYTDRDNDERRIISAWKAEPHEQRSYWRKRDQ